MDINRKTKKNIRDYAIIGALMAFTATFCLIFLTPQSLRLDESQSLYQSSNTPTRIISIIAADVHVPLYHIVLHYWQVVFGNDVGTARILSLIFFVLTIPAVYMLGKITFGRSVALFASTLVAVSPFLNWYGSEIRMYSLLTLLTVLNQYFFVRIYKKHKKYSPIRNTAHLWAGYLITSVVGVFTHYFFFLLLLGQGIFLFSYKAYFYKTTIKKFAAVGAVVAVAFTPWVYKIISAGEVQNAEPQIGAPTATNIFNTFSSFLFGFQPDDANKIIVAFWPLATIFSFLVLSKNLKRRISIHVPYFILSIVVALSAVYILSISVRPFYLTRYFIFLIPSFYLVIAWILSIYTQKRFAKLVKTVLVAGMIAGLLHQVTGANIPVQENYKAANDYLMKNASSRDIIVCARRLSIYGWKYYYTGPAAIETLPRWNRLEFGAIPQFDEDKLPEELESIALSHENIWLVVSVNQGYEGQIIGYFNSNYERIEKKEFSPGLTLYGYRLRYDIEDRKAVIKDIIQAESTTN